jgi:hypothetical protein
VVRSHQRRQSRKKSQICTFSRVSTMQRQIVAGFREQLSNTLSTLLHQGLGMLDRADMDTTMCEWGTRSRHVWSVAQTPPSLKLCGLRTSFYVGPPTSSFYFWNICTAVIPTMQKELRKGRVPSPSPESLRSSTNLGNSSRRDLRVGVPTHPSIFPYSGATLDASQCVHWTHAFH